jgi:peptidoglycan/xylan/chitin deacetylase (PgdA/CDA1 family)
VLQYIDKNFIIYFLILLLLSISKSFGINLNEFNPDKGVIALMYHRFNENKYPSTNIKSKIFLEHLDEVNNSKLEFISFSRFSEIIKTKMQKNYLLLTIDDAFESFYLNAWPVLKKKKIPFVLFVSTREMGKQGYMNWDQIKEIANEEFVHIGNHSHSHEYLIDMKLDEINKDIRKSISILKNQIGYESKFFSYPFGEYSLEFKNLISKLNFKYGFGQHSGVIDETKDLLELPRFPINEKYGSIKRFNTILHTLPFKYKSSLPKEKYINDKTNPPNVVIDFFPNIENLKQINCYSNEENQWRKSKINFLGKNKINILLDGKFTTERGRINCSLQEENGYWRWLGLQYVVKEK